MRTSAQALGEGLVATLAADEFTDPIDRDAFAFVVAESILMWRRSMTKG
jgi:hypothetical protein